MRILALATSVRLRRLARQQSVGEQPRPRTAAGRRRPRPRRRSAPARPSSSRTASTMPPLADPSSLREHDARHLDRLGERPRLRDAVLARSGRRARAGSRRPGRPPSRSRASPCRARPSAGSWCADGRRCRRSGRRRPGRCADFTASNATAPGSAPRSWPTRCAPARVAHTSSCSPAAARNVSAAARLTCLPSATSRFASLPIVVVLPAPFTPTTITTPVGPCGSRSGSSGPSTATISSREQRRPGRRRSRSRP